MADRYLAFSLQFLNLYSLYGHDSYFSPMGVSWKIRQDSCKHGNIDHNQRGQWHTSLGSRPFKSLAVLGMPQAFGALLFVDNCYPARKLRNIVFIPVLYSSYLLILLHNCVIIINWGIV